MTNCCVPLCKNSHKTRRTKPGLKFHRFPVDEKECKKWIQLIRRKDFEWTMNSMICSWHFPEGKHVGPTRFHWNENKNFRLNGLTERSRGRKKIIQIQENVSVSEVDPASTDEAFCGLQTKILEQEEKINKLEELVESLQNVTSQQRKTIVSIGVDMDGMRYENRKLRDLLEYYKKFEPANHELNGKIRELQNVLRNGQTHATSIFTSDISTWDNQLLSSFTGFQSMSSVQILIEVFRIHGINYKGSNIACLSLLNQVILFLMKLRLDLSNPVLSKLFNISTTSVSRIFETLLNATHEFFFEGEGPLNTIPSREKTSQCLPKCFLNEMENCRIVIDCTEFTMESPRLMDQKKLTYSSYKSRYTMKSLVGCSPSGVPVFVSELYGGSMSDKAIVSGSGMMGQMVSGDLILADKGFEIYDILPPGVALNIPSFLTTNQFTLNETIKNRAIARARIIIERLNARFKIFKILNCITAGSRSKANKLVKVCVALTTMMPTLMDELNEVE